MSDIRIGNLTLGLTLQPGAFQSLTTQITHYKPVVEVELKVKGNGLQALGSLDLTRVTREMEQLKIVAGGMGSLEINPRITGLRQLSSLQLAPITGQLSALAPVLKAVSNASLKDFSTGGLKALAGLNFATVAKDLPLVVNELVKLNGFSSNINMNGLRQLEKLDFQKVSATLTGLMPELQKLSSLAISVNLGGFKALEKLDYSKVMAGLPGLIGELEKLSGLSLKFNASGFKALEKVDLVKLGASLPSVVVELEKLSQVSLNLKMNGLKALEKVDLSRLASELPALVVQLEKLGAIPSVDLKVSGLRQLEKINVTSVTANLQALIPVIEQLSRALPAGGLNISINASNLNNTRAAIAAFGGSSEAAAGQVRQVVTALEALRVKQEQEAASLRSMGVLTAEQSQQLRMLEVSISQTTARLAALGAQEGGTLGVARALEQGMTQTAQAFRNGGLSAQEYASRLSSLQAQMKTEIELLRGMGPLALSDAEALRVLGNASQVAAAEMARLSSATGAAQARVGVMAGTLRLLNSSALFLPGTLGQAAMGAQVLTSSLGGLNTASLATKFAVGGIVLGLGAFIAISYKAVTSAAALERQQGYLETITSQNKGGYADLTVAIQNMTKTLPMTAMELYKIAEAGAQLGVKGTRDLSAFADTVAKVSIATRAPAEQIADNLTKFLTQTGVVAGSKEYLTVLRDMGNTLAAVANQSNATAASTLKMASYMAAGLSEIGVSREQILGISAALASMGQRAESGGSSVSRIILKMGEAAAAGGDRFAAMAKTAGMTQDAFKALIISAPTEALTALGKGLGSTRLNAVSLAEILGDLGIKNVQDRKVLLQLTSAWQEVNRVVKLAGTAAQDKTALDRLAAQATDNLIDKFKTFGNKVEILGANFGKILLPALNSVVDFLNRLFDSGGNADKQMNTIATTVGVLTIAFGALAKMNPWILAITGALELLGYLGTIQNDIDSINKFGADNTKQGQDALKSAASGPSDTAVQAARRESARLLFIRDDLQGKVEKNLAASFLQAGGYKPGKGSNQTLTAEAMLGLSNSSDAEVKRGMELLDKLAKANTALEAQKKVVDGLDTSFNKLIATQDKVNPRLYAATVAQLGGVENSVKLMQDLGKHPEEYNNGGKGHMGRDYAIDPQPNGEGRMGASIYAPSSFDGAKVLSAGPMAGYGNAVKLELKNGYQAILGHFEQVKVLAGSSVKAGELLGLQGNSGHGFGGANGGNPVHLHLELKDAQGHAIYDPAVYGAVLVGQINKGASSAKVDAKPTKESVAQDIKDTAQALSLLTASDPQFDVLEKKLKSFQAQWKSLGGAAKTYTALVKEGREMLPEADPALEKAALRYREIQKELEGNGGNKSGARFVRLKAESDALEKKYQGISQIAAYLYKDAGAEKLLTSTKDLQGALSVTTSRLKAHVLTTDEASSSYGALKTQALELADTEGKAHGTKTRNYKDLMVVAGNAQKAIDALNKSQTRADDSAARQAESDAKAVLDGKDTLAQSQVEGSKLSAERRKADYDNQKKMFEQRKASAQEFIDLENTYGARYQAALKLQYQTEDRSSQEQEEARHAAKLKEISAIKDEAARKNALTLENSAYSKNKTNNSETARQALNSIGSDAQTNLNGAQEKLKTEVEKHNQAVKDLSESYIQLRKDALSSAKDGKFDSSKIDDFKSKLSDLSSKAKDADVDLKGIYGKLGDPTKFLELVKGINALKVAKVENGRADLELAKEDKTSAQVRLEGTAQNLKDTLELYKDEPKLRLKAIKDAQPGLEAANKSVLESARRVSALEEAQQHADLMATLTNKAAIEKENKRHAQAVKNIALGNTTELKKLAGELNTRLKDATDAANKQAEQQLNESIDARILRVKAEQTALETKYEKEKVDAKGNLETLLKLEQEYGPRIEAAKNRVARIENENASAGLEQKYKDKDLTNPLVSGAKADEQFALGTNYSADLVRNALETQNRLLNAQKAFTDATLANDHTQATESLKIASKSADDAHAKLLESVNRSLSAEGVGAQGKLKLLQDNNEQLIALETKAKEARLALDKQAENFAFDAEKKRLQEQGLSTETLEKNHKARLIQLEADKNTAIQTLTYTHNEEVRKARETANQETLSSTRTFADTQTQATLEGLAGIRDARKAGLEDQLKLVKDDAGKMLEAQKTLGADLEQAEQDVLSRQLEADVKAARRKADDRLHNNEDSQAVEAWFAAEQTRLEAAANRASLKLTADQGKAVLDLEKAVGLKGQEQLRALKDIALERQKTGLERSIALTEAARDRELSEADTDVTKRLEIEGRYGTALLEQRKGLQAVLRTQRDMAVNRDFTDAKIGTGVRDARLSDSGTLEGEGNADAAQQQVHREAAVKKAALLEGRDQRRAFEDLDAQDAKDGIERRQKDLEAGYMRDIKKAGDNATERLKIARESGAKLLEVEQERIKQEQFDRDTATRREFEDKKISAEVRDKRLTLSQNTATGQLGTAVQNQADRVSEAEQASTLQGLERTRQLEDAENKRRLTALEGTRDGLETLYGDMATYAQGNALELLGIAEEGGQKILETEVRILEERRKQALQAADRYRDDQLEKGMSLAQIQPVYAGMQGDAQLEFDTAKGKLEDARAREMNKARVDALKQGAQLEADLSAVALEKQKSDDEALRNQKKPDYQAALEEAGSNAALRLEVERTLGAELYALERKAGRDEEQVALQTAREKIRIGREQNKDLTLLLADYGLAEQAALNKSLETTKTLDAARSNSLKNATKDAQTFARENYRTQVGAELTGEQGTAQNTLNASSSAATVGTGEAALSGKSPEEQYRIQSEFNARLLQDARALEITKQNIEEEGARQAREDAVHKAQEQHKSNAEILELQGQFDAADLVRHTDQKQRLSDIDRTYGDKATGFLKTLLEAQGSMSAYLGERSLKAVIKTTEDSLAIDEAGYKAAQDVVESNAAQLEAAYQTYGARILLGQKNLEDQKAALLTAGENARFAKLQVGHIATEEEALQHEDALRDILATASRARGALEQKDRDT